MIMDRTVLKGNAKNTLRGGYWSCVLTGLVLAIASGQMSGGTGNYNFEGKGGDSSGFPGGGMNSYDIEGLFSSLGIPTYMLGVFAVVLLIVVMISFLLVIFLLQPLEVGCRKFFIDSRRGDYRLSDIGMAFSSTYMNIVKTMFLRQLYIFLWSLLFIIPGIIKSYEYRMIPYILAENPEISSQDAFASSRQMMYGSKFDAFVFDLSFLLWFMLDALTLGIVGIFYVNPYYANACTELYAFVKSKETYYTNGQEYGYGGQESFYGQQGYGYGGQESSYGEHSSEAGSDSRQDPADTGNTVSADDARPFNRPYGE